MSNAIITNDGVWKKGIGKYLNIKYIVETTKEDELIEEIYFSNIYTVECKSIDQAMKTINQMQKKGWHNINLTINIDYKDKTIMEDIANNIEVKINTDKLTRTHNENIELRKKVEEMQKEIKLYQTFIKKYKAEKLFEEFKNESSNDESKLYWYEYKYRGCSPGCQPDDFVKVDHTKGRFGIVAYKRPLTKKELDEYELRPYSA